MDENRGTRLTFGLLLILAGMLILGTNLGMLRGQVLWPFFILFPGLFLLILAFTSRSARGAVFPGTIVTLIGLLFLAWRNQWFPINMADFWPIFPTIVGFAFLMLFAFMPNDWGVLVPAFILLGVGLVFFGINYNVLDHSILRYWPVLLVLIGIISMARSLIRPLDQRQDSEGNPAERD